MLIRIVLLLSFVCTLFLNGCNDNLNRLARTESIDYQYDINTQNRSPENELDYQQIIQQSDSNDILNLNQALALTLIHNPELKAYSLAIRIAEANQLQESLKPNPELEIESEEIGGSGDRTGFDSAETTIQLSQTIELGNKAQKRENVASLEKEISQLNYQIAKLEILGEVAKAFLQVLSSQEKLKLSNELLKISTESFEAVQKRVDAGKDSPLELKRSSIALSNIKTDNQQAYLELENARKYLASFWSQDNLPFKEVDGDFYAIEQIEPYEHYSTLLTTTPNYKLLELEVRKSQAELNLEKSKSIVDMTIGAGVQNFNETDDNAFVLSMSIPLPISDRNQGARQAAIYNLAQKKQLQKASETNILNTLNETYSTYSNTYNIISLTQTEILPAAIDLFESAKTAYLEGKIDYLNMLDAQLTFYEVQNKYIENLTSYKISVVEIECLTGQNIGNFLNSEKEESN